MRTQELTKAEKDAFVRGVGRALRRAAKAARKKALETGTCIYIERDGKVVAIDPRKEKS